jgi:hypothetical protein
MEIRKGRPPDRSFKKGNEVFSVKELQKIKRINENIINEGRVIIYASEITLKTAETFLACGIVLREDGKQLQDPRAIKRVFGVDKKIFFYPFKAVGGVKWVKQVLGASF